MPTLFYIICGAVAVISLMTFLLYAIDKYKARHGMWRIPERVLLHFSILGGGIGGLAAMLLFRHKTRHIYFTVANILGIILSLGLIAASIFVF